MFSEALLRELLDAFRDHDAAETRIGSAWFQEATFADGARFIGVKFTKSVSFWGATFNESAVFQLAEFVGGGDFLGTTFANHAQFDSAKFGKHANFGGATFLEGASFDRTKFENGATFNGVTFSETAFFRDARFFANPNGAYFRGSDFKRAKFKGWVVFSGAQFEDDIDFSEAEFHIAPHFGPVVCRGALRFDSASFAAPVTMEIAAREISCVRTRWDATAELRLRYAAVDLNDAMLSAPIAVTAHDNLFIRRGGAASFDGDTYDESLLTQPANTAVAQSQIDPRVEVTSVRGVDAAHLVMRGVDLTKCVFSGAFHLDLIGIEGNCTFAMAPVGTKRRTLAEEHHWRAQKHRNQRRGWQPTIPGGSPSDAREVAATYRHLRKALEDSKNEPGAADFYYGEMEMRRHSREGAAEYCLLWIYWLCSGYGLRALRAIVWLAAIMMLTIVILMAFGLPASPGPTGKSTVTINPIGLSTAPVDPSGAAPTNWFTWPRLDRAIRTVFNSAVFRSAGEGLTVNGTYIEMVSRFIEPILLLLAVLAIRSRVKR